MTEIIIILGLFIGSNLCTAFFVRKYINRKWRLETREHLDKIAKRARQIEKDYGNIEMDDDFWDNLPDFMR